MQPAAVRMRLLTFSVINMTEFSQQTYKLLGVLQPNKEMDSLPFRKDGFGNPDILGKADLSYAIRKVPKTQKMAEIKATSASK